jgi:mutator protein MutT
MNDPSTGDAPLRCDAALRAAIELRLVAFARQSCTEPNHQHAAVAVAIAEEGLGADLSGLPNPKAWSDRAALILTRRAAALRSHAGQWALPGGRIDPGETPEQAALRELDEEIALRLPATAVLGRLDDFVTRSGYVITPVVVWAGAARGLRANPDEVQSIHRISIAEFMRVDAPILQPTDDPARPVLLMPVASTWIAAPTAAVLYQFRELCIAGRATRVVHFDQPAFAWK